MNRAKIICTLGPASSEQEIIGKLIDAGMNVARLNFSHGEHDTHKKVAVMVRQEAGRRKKVVSILQDLQGIKIRISPVKNDAVDLPTNSEVKLMPGYTDLSDNKTIYITYPALINDLKKDDIVLIDDGLIRIVITGKTDKYLTGKVAEGGILKSRKGANFPTSKTSLPAFTDKDKRDLEFGLAIGVDYVAISFVRTAEDIDAVIKWADERNLTLPPLIAKIEKPEALNNIDYILDKVDGIMVARGDLGVEMPTEQVPTIQKSLIATANRKGKIVITATQMLESMTKHSRPTRAEASDVANAVLDGSDALMLSAETAAGRFPVEAVSTMKRIIMSTESNIVGGYSNLYVAGNSFAEAIADGACKAASDIKAKAIVVFTHSGFTAKLISKFKPRVPIIVFSPDETTFRRLPLFWGTTPKLIRKKNLKLLDTSFLEEVEKILINDSIVKTGDNIVLVASSPFLGKPNIIRLHRI